MTAAEQLMARGEERARRETLLELLRDQFGALPEAVSTQVAAANTTQLLAWIKRVLTVPALDDVFATP